MSVIGCQWNMLSVVTFLVFPFLLPCLAKQHTVTTRSDGDQGTGLLSVFFFQQRWKTDVFPCCLGMRSLRVSVHAALYSVFGCRQANSNPLACVHNEYFLNSAQQRITKTGHDPGLTLCELKFL